MLTDNKDHKWIGVLQKRAMDTKKTVRKSAEIVQSKWWVEETTLKKSMRLSVCLFVCLCVNSFFRYSSA